MTKAVDTAALTALTAPARELLLSTTLSALLQERGLADAHDVVTLETDNTVADAMTSLAKHNVASAPLLRRSAASSGLGGGVVFLGFVDVPSLMKAFFKGARRQRRCGLCPVTRGREAPR